jgi:hypothetical protein
MNYTTKRPQVAHIESERGDLDLGALSTGVRYSLSVQVLGVGADAQPKCESLSSKGGRLL